MAMLARTIGRTLMQVSKLIKKKISYAAQPTAYINILFLPQWNMSV